jgi:hypothetical protein
MQNTAICEMPGIEHGGLMACWIGCLIAPECFAM